MKKIKASRIDELIREAIAESNRNKATKNSKGFALTPEAKALASQFEQNKGKLPWPVDTTELSHGSLEGNLTPFIRVIM